MALKCLRRLLCSDASCEVGTRKCFNCYSMLLLSASRISTRISWRVRSNNSGCPVKSVSGMVQDDEKNTSWRCNVVL